MSTDTASSRMIYQVDGTRDRILDAAQRLFIERGLFDVTMKDLATQIGISRASLYRYYRDKLDLALDVMSKVLTGLPAGEAAAHAKETGKTGLDKAFIFLEHYWLNPGYIANYRYLAEFDSYFSGARAPQAFRQRLAEALDQCYPGMLEEYLQEGIGDGSIRSDIELDITAEMLQNALRALHHRVLLRGELLIEVHEENLQALPKLLLSHLKESLAARA